MKKNSDGEAKAMRVLSLFFRLTQGEALVREKEAERFGVSSKSIQRDIDEIRNFLGQQDDYQSVIEYRKDRGGYVLVSASLLGLQPEEAVALAKILLESRSFVKEELHQLLDKIIIHCGKEDRKEIDDIIRNELYHYVEPQHGKPLFSLVLAIARAVRQNRLIHLTYLRVGDTEPVIYDVEPLGVIFSEFYYYLVAFISGRGYQYPAIYRLDRIVKYQTLEDVFHIPYGNRFEEGDFRKKIQFMQMGKLEHVRFRFWGRSPEAVLDRLPTAREIRREADGIVYEAEVFGEGVKMWFLSQGECLEVLSPESLRQSMAATTRHMAKLYGDFTQDDQGKGRNSK